MSKPLQPIDEFKEIDDIEGYLEFFSIPYDKSLVNVKRLHILKAFGQMIAKIEEQELSDEKMLEYYRFALVSVYKNYESGYSPSAAEVWNLFENPTPCFSCSTIGNCSTDAINTSSSGGSCVSHG